MRYLLDVAVITALVNAVIYHIELVAKEQAGMTRQLWAGLPQSIPGPLGLVWILEFFFKKTAWAPSKSITNRPLSRHAGQEREGGMSERPSWTIPSHMPSTAPPPPLWHHRPSMHWSMMSQWGAEGPGLDWGEPHAICGFWFFFTYFLIVSFFSTISCEWGSPLTTNESSVVKDAAARCLATSYLSKKQWKLPTEVLNFPTCIQIGNKNCVWTPKRYLHCQSFIQCMFLLVMFYY